MFKDPFVGTVTLEKVYGTREQPDIVRLVEVNSAPLLIASGLICGEIRSSIPFDLAVFLCLLPSSDTYRFTNVLYEFTSQDFNNLQPDETITLIQRRHGDMKRLSINLTGEAPVRTKRTKRTMVAEHRILEL